ncbi:hypothetical protein Nepgr_016874 [Nepenthes gracilis]|uniref:Uncharacterized protein n=1 Tax=Nepenthes gracilis TaxID=150966 RepID=A0AAD3SNE9_NEPGR|nr:hypothetical protein Nepgr_016874 [Nepenthes gracilis]
MGLSSISFQHPTAHYKYPQPSFFSPRFNGVTNTTPTDLFSLLSLAFSCENLGIFQSIQISLWFSLDNCNRLLITLLFSNRHPSVPWFPSSKRQLLNVQENNNIG